VELLITFNSKLDHLKKLYNQSTPTPLCRRRWIRLSGNCIKRNSWWEIEL